MKIKQYRNQFIQKLSSLYDTEEATSFFYLILEAKHQLNRVDLALQPELFFLESELQTWNLILDQLQKEVPVQYILGQTYFYGLKLEVNPDVLIPRPETEELVAWIIESNLNTEQGKGLKILDIGTGSGCIAIALAKNLANAQVVAIDVSEKALATAKKNASLNQVTIRFQCQNILEIENLEAQYDIIVSNPPYVRNLEKATIKSNVLHNEPHLALFVADTDALVFYRKIAQLAQKNTTKKGQLYFEINQYLGTEMCHLLHKMNFKTHLRKDIYGNDRMIKSEQ